MTKILIPILSFFFLISTSTYSQVTIGNIEKKEETVVVRPPAYDSLKNWEEIYREKIEILGLNIYIPPYKNEELQGAFVTEGTCIPFHDTERITNQYFTITKVIEHEELVKTARACNNALGGPNYAYELKNNNTGEKILCGGCTYILVPYFIKQQQLYKNQKLIFVGGKFAMSDSENNYNPVCNDLITGKKIVIKPKSEWTCIDVTLLRNERVVRDGKLEKSNNIFEIYYILKNENNEEFAINNLGNPQKNFPFQYYFTTKIEYLKKQKEELMQEQERINKEKLDEKIRLENEKRALNKYKAECVNRFGQHVGELIAQGKVEIGMSTEMCETAWGRPYDINKSTTTAGTLERWFYSRKYNLYFENNILTRIQH